ncbi:trypsin-3-like isoform X2 [Palaemon carinicauda]|uniref:trypsin-3-like isoform X2 n=1 Tax=Palaemon carinicauda TaxID=392227 RepID=UPI0035B5A6A0
MNRTPIMLLLFILIAWTTICVMARINGCRSNGGICRKSQIKQCERLHEKCSNGRLCCKKGPRGEKGKDKKECDDKACKGMGGICLTKAKRDAATAACGVLVNIPELCPGKNCVCCLRGNNACGITSLCRLSGGICVKGKRKLLDNGNLLRNGCASDSCHCYVAGNVCSCGIAKKLRVIGGKEVPIPNKYPWLVGIRKKSKRMYECGGTIINNFYVLTAAHCVRQGRKIISPKTLLIGVADHNYNSKEDDIKGVTRQVKIDKIITHPKYEDDLPGFDIALIRLKKKLVFDGNIAPACLPTGSKTYNDEKGVALGWGSVDNETYTFSSFAREITLPILSQNCDGIKFSSVKITKFMLCAGGLEGKDTCAGDSGGPLTVREDGRYILVGITSFGFGCAQKGLPAVYTRVSEFREWIIKNTKDATYCS